MELYTVFTQQAGQTGMERTRVLKNGEATDTLESTADAANSKTISQDGMRMKNSLSAQTYKTSMTSMNSNSMANEANINTHSNNTNNEEEQQELIRIT